MRTLRASCVIGLLAVAVPVRAVDGSCKVATKGTSPVAKACAKGGPEHGAREARKEMKRLVEKAKEKTGKKVECAQCHDGVNDDRYDLLKKDAAKQLDALVALVGGA